MIKWILFDQNGVQIKDTFAHKPIYSVNGKNFDAPLLESVYDLPEYSLFDKGKLSESDLITIFLEKTKLDLSLDEFILLFKEGVESIDGVGEILSSLKSKGYKLASVINEGSSWANYSLEASGFKKFFDINIISGDIGLIKPDVDFYKKTIDLIDAKPEECIFIDDKKRNCDAASDFGMYSIVFENSVQLKNELLSLGVKF